MTIKGRKRYIALLGMLILLCLAFTSCVSKPTTVEELINSNEEIAEQLATSSGSSNMTLEIKGNEIIYSYDLSGIEGATEEKSFGLGEVAGTAAAGAAAGTALTKAEKKAAKKAEKKAKKEAAKNVDPQVEYENVDAGSTILTILAVIVAVLLVVLLAIILVLHLAPSSELALGIDEFIENITSRFSVINTFGGHRLL